jgi:hypothetical protein
MMQIGGGGQNPSDCHKEERGRGIIGNCTGIMGWWSSVEKRGLENRQEERTGEEYTLKAAST